MGSLLIIFGCGDEKKAVQMVPWNVIIMVLGVGIFNECYLPVRRYRYHGSGSGACYEQTDCCDDHGYYFWVYVLLQFRS